MNKTQALVWNVLRLVLVTGMVVLSAIACDTGSGGGSNGDPPGGDPPGGDPPGGDPPDGDTPDGDPPDGDTPDGDTPGVNLANYSFTYPIATLKADGTIEATPIWNENPGAGVSYAISPSFGTDNNSTLSFDKTDGTITGKMPDAGEITVYTITASGNDSTSSTATGTFVDRFTFSAYTSSTAGTAISTAQDLQDIEDANGEYYLTNHIDLSALASTWTPLFAEDNPFTGTLHGNGYVIHNLEITGGAGNHYQGLFAALEDASIENLGIGVKNIAGGGAIGALAGYANGTSSLALSNIAAGAMSDAAKIKSTASLTIDAVDGSYVGGVIGYLEAGTLENAYNLVAVEGSSHTVGGLVGWNGNAGTVTGYATGAVSGNGNVGGLVGRNEGTATGYATGDVSGGSFNVGGLVGYNKTGTVTGYATGDVSGGKGVGGLVGQNEDGTATGYATGAVSGNLWVGGLVGYNKTGTATGYATGVVSGASYVGGLVGYNKTGTATGYATGVVSGASYVGGLVGQNAGTATGYARGSVTRKSGALTTFGLLAGADLGTLLGYHSGTAGESNLNSIFAEDAEGVDGTKIADIVAAAQGSFVGFTFGTEVGKWVWKAGEWPAIVLPTQ